MESDHSDTSLFDMADWLWSFRWLMLACLAIAIGWMLWAWQNAKDPAPFYEVKLQIFSGGTPVRGPAEIADILVDGIKTANLELVSAPGSNPVIYRTSDSQMANRVEVDVAPVTAALLAEVVSQQSELSRLLRTNENALPQYLSTKSFIEGVKSGLITPVVTTVTLMEASERSRVVTLLVPAISSGFLFLLIAGGISFSREWKRHRKPT